MNRYITSQKPLLPLAVSYKAVLLSKAAAATFLVVSTVVCTVFVTFSTRFKKYFKRGKQVC